MPHLTVEWNDDAILDPANGIMAISKPGTTEYIRIPRSTRLRISVWDDETWSVYFMSGLKTTLEVKAIERHAKPLVEWWLAPTRRRGST